MHIFSFSFSVHPPANKSMCISRVGIVFVCTQSEYFRRVVRARINKSSVILSLAVSSGGGGRSRVDVGVRPPRVLSLGSTQWQIPGERASGGIISVTAAISTLPQIQGQINGIGPALVSCALAEAHLHTKWAVTKLLLNLIFMRTRCATETALF